MHLRRRLVLSKDPADKGTAAIPPPTDDSTGEIDASKRSSRTSRTGQVLSGIVEMASLTPEIEADTAGRESTQNPLQQARLSFIDEKERRK